MSAEVNSPFGKLPIEMKSKLFTFLSNKDRMSARLVCRSWLPVASEMLTFCGVITDETKQWIQECGYQFQSLSLQNLRGSIQMSSYFNAFPQVQQYIIGPGNSSPNILNFLRYFPSNIQNLTIQNLAFSNLKAYTLARVVRKIKWSSLSSLSLTMNSAGIGRIDSDDYKDHPPAIKENSLSHSQAINEILEFVRVKTLRHLTIQLFAGRTQETEKRWDMIVNFILKHSDSLRELRLVLFGKPIPEKPYPSGFVSGYYHSLNDYSNLGHFEKLNLQKISFEYDVYHSMVARALSIQMKGLECLELQGDLRTMSRRGIEIEDDKEFARGLSIHTHRFIPEHIIGSHSSTLKTIRCKFHLTSLQWFGSFNNLKEIELKIIELRPFRGLPFFPVLTKFSFILVKAPVLSTFPTLFIQGIVAQMRNAEELELVFLDTPCFEIHHLQDLRDLQKLRKVTIGKVSTDDNSLKLYCDETPGLSFTRQRKVDVSELSVRTPFQCAVIQIGDPKIGLNKGVQKIQQENY